MDFPQQTALKSTVGIPIVRQSIICSIIPPRKRTIAISTNRMECLPLFSNREDSTLLGNAQRDSPLSGDLNSHSTRLPDARPSKSTALAYSPFASPPPDRQSSSGCLRFPASPSLSCKFRSLPRPAGDKSSSVTRRRQLTVLFGTRAARTELHRSATRRSHPRSRPRGMTSGACRRG